MAAILSRRGNPVPIGTTQSPWSLFTAALTHSTNASLDALTARLAPGTTAPVTNNTTGFYCTPLLDAANGVFLRFYGFHASDPNNGAGTARVWGFAENPLMLAGTKPQTLYYQATHLADLALTCGDTVMSPAPTDAGATGVYKLVDTVTASVDNTFTPGIEVVGGLGADGVADAWLDSIGFPFIAVQVAVGAGLSGLGAMFRQV